MVSPRGAASAALMRSDPDPARRIVHRLVPPGVRPDPDHLRHDPRHLRRRVELPLALPGLGREVSHEVLVRVPEEVVPVGPVGAEIEPLEDPDELREPLLHLLPAAEPAFVGEVGLVDHPLQEVVVRVGERADDLVDSVADLLGPLERHHVGEAAAGRDRDVGVRVAGVRVLVRHVLHEEQREHVVLVLGRVHPPAQLVAAPPQRRVEVGFAEGHGGGGGGGAVVVDAGVRAPSEDWGGGVGASRGVEK